ncbi:glycosyltransferase [Microbacterium sp. NPDC064584]|uniref:glycosyltransferase n=1 Tax=Microbacterium sp. NPDC064584 TaxID=3155817 RepID=UPI00341A8DF4
MASHGVWAVVTAYRPGPSLAGEVASILRQVDGVMLVDDGSGPEFDSTLKAAESRGVTVIRLRENSGIAVALNAGIRAALETGADRVVTLDQDSRIGLGFVEALVDAHDHAQRSGLRVGPVVPEYFAEVRQAHGDSEDGVLRARRVIQSGMLLGRDLLSHVGLMLEPLFIDLVDTEYELRCSSAGFVAVAAPGLVLEHRLGVGYRRRGPALPGIPRVMMLSTPFRYYYRARNRVLVNRLHARRHRGRILRDTVADAVYFTVVCAMARPRKAMWSLLKAGWHDGRTGRGGRMAPRVAAVADSVRWAADRIAESP